MTRKLVHADMRFDPNASPQCYRSNDEVIQKDTRVRMQIVGCRIESNDIVRLSGFSHAYTHHRS